MSFLQVQPGVLAKDTWRTIVAHPVYDDRTTDQLSWWEVFPASFSDMCEWACVVKNPHSNDYTRPYHVLYKDPRYTVDSVDIAMYPVTLRFQGRLGSFKLGVFGGWHGRPEEAASAVQYLCLNGRDNPAAWGASLTAIRQIKQLVSSTLHGGRTYIEPLPDARRDLYFHRRVFIKNRVGLDLPANHLHFSDDPHNWYPRVCTDWVLAEKLQIGHVLENGSTAAASAMSLSVGDFVDVGATIDVAAIRLPSGRFQTKVHFVLNHVLQVASGTDKKGKPSPTVRSPLESQTYTVHSSGMVFPTVNQFIQEDPEEIATPSLDLDLEGLSLTNDDI